MRTIVKVAAVGVLAAALTFTAASPADARGGHWKRAHRGPVAAVTPTPTPTTEPTVTPTTPTDDDPGDADFTETFDTSASTATFAKTYADSWQPYPDGTGGMYYSGQVITAHDGYMDVALDGKRGAAGTFGTPDGAWGHVGGTFSIRAKATGGDGNGAAVMLWPTSNVWADGEIDYPEGNFDSTPMVFHHSMVKGQEASAQAFSTGVTWRDWHTYSETWIPGKSITYSIDGKVIGTVTKNVPTTAHRYMFQVGDWGDPGHLLIDWVATDD